MKAIVIEEFGSAEQLKEVDMPKPSIKEHQVLIEVRAFSINAIDWKRRSGKMGGNLPLVLGGDVAGIISEVGANVTDLKIGDRVFANAARTYAEFTKARAEVTVKIPDNLSFEEAASIPLIGQTAWESLVEQGHLQAGDKVLIHAGAGGVGSLAIQIAKHFNAYVAATASEKNREFLIALGVDRFIDYKNEDFEQVLTDFDLVLDLIGGETQEKSFSVLKKGGRLISLVQEPDQKKANSLGITGTHFSMSPTGERLKELTELLAYGAIKPIVTQTYAFTEEDLRKAHEQIEAGHTRGKLVVKVN
ncbi:NADP-dependent oxidoreductase [Carnobacterium pleistocenium]|uniref:NADP-dependent oxidoreductase n=1 Tax=Carnobacterium pleistocenium TaxID=181073 RepID=UPI00054D28DF|nr:NADP-dependent oxidoreductase [Carnobacterium pleistocenium]